MASIHLIFFFFFLLPTALPFHFGQKDSELLWERERERERERESFDILFWGRNEEIDVIRLREYDLIFVFLIIIGIFYSLKFLGKELNKQRCNANVMSGIVVQYQTIFRLEFFWALNLGIITTVWFCRKQRKENETKKKTEF